jgi:cholesterol transport system auxiliary component
MNFVRACALLAAACAAGCAGSLLQSKIPQQTTYVLSVPAASAPATASIVLPVDLSILKPHLSPGLETDRILALYPDRRLDYFAGTHWTGTLDDVVQDLAVQTFKTRGELRSVNGESSRFADQFWLEIEVEDFQAEYRAPNTVPSVRVRLSARLGGADDRRSLGNFEAMALRPAADNRLGDIVAAYELAANDALGQVAAQVTATLLKIPPSAH